MKLGVYKRWTQVIMKLRVHKRGKLVFMMLGLKNDMDNSNDEVGSKTDGNCIYEVGRKKKG